MKQINFPTMTLDEDIYLEIEAHLKENNLLKDLVSKKTRRRAFRKIICEMIIPKGWKILKSELEQIKETQKEKAVTPAPVIIQKPVKKKKTPLPSKGQSTQNSAV